MRYSVATAVLRIWAALRNAVMSQLAVLTGAAWIMAATSAIASETKTPFFWPLKQCHLVLFGEYLWILPPLLLFHQTLFSLSFILKDKRHWSLLSSMQTIWPKAQCCVSDQPMAHRLEIVSTRPMPLWWSFWPSHTLELWQTVILSLSVKMLWCLFCLPQRGVHYFCSIFFLSLFYSDK